MHQLRPRYQCYNAHPKPTSTQTQRNTQLSELTMVYASGSNKTREVMSGILKA